MPVFELVTSGIGSDLSANWATTNDDLAISKLARVGHFMNFVLCKKTLWGIGSNDDDSSSSRYLKYV